MSEGVTVSVAPRPADREPSKAQLHRRDIEVREKSKWLCE